MRQLQIFQLTRKKANRLRSLSHFEVQIYRLRCQFQVLRKKIALDVDLIGLKALVLEHICQVEISPVDQHNPFVSSKNTKYSSKLKIALMTTHYFKMVILPNDNRISLSQDIPLFWWEQATSGTEPSSQLMEPDFTSSEVVITSTTMT